MLKVKRNGNFIELSDKENTALDATLRSRLHARFHYVKKEMEFVGRKGVLVSHDEYLLVDTDRGTLVTSYGMFPQLRNWLTGNGYEYQCVDVTPPDRNYVKLEPDWSALDKQSFRAGQRECLEAIIRERHGIVAAPVGFGKTFLLSVLIQLYPKAKFHICTRSRDVLNEIYKRLVLVSPDVGMFCGTRKDRDCRVTVITADSLGCLDADDVAFFIFDECHQAAAPTYMANILSKYTLSRMYGFSATPTGRSDGADAALTYLFGDVIYQMAYSDGVDNGLVVPINVKWLHCTVADGTSGYWSSPISRQRHLIWRNKYRNQLISEYVHGIPDDERVLVLVSKLEHAVYLKQYLPEFELVHGTMKTEDLNDYIRKGLLPDGYQPLKAKDRDRMKEDFKHGRIKKVIATGVWSTGVDFAELSHVVIAAGGASPILVTQSGGRASRIALGKNGATVVDIVDEFDGKNSVFYRHSASRKKTYEGLGWRNDDWKLSRR